MKKYIAIACCLALNATAFAQETEAMQDLKAEVNEGIVKFETEDGKYSFRVGARVDLDGSLYFDDYTDRGSGADISTARVRVISKLGNKFDFKLDIDFMSKTFLKDAYLRWHSNKNGFVRIGHFAEPFSAENIQSTMDYPFIAKSATTQAFGTGRALGISYRYYHPYFWGEGGVFSEKLHENHKQGDMGWAATARLLGRVQGEDWHVHAGGSLSYRRPDANGFANGNDDYNRTVTFASNLESSIDDTKFLSVTANNAKHIYKYNVELMGHYKKFYLKGEWTGVDVDRERDWNALAQSYVGTMMGAWFPTADSWKAFLGDDHDYSFSGYSAEVGVIAIGGDYKYNSVDAMMRRPKGKTLEFVARYNHTNLEDIVPGSIFYNNGYTGTGFYSNPTMIEWYMTNDSAAGGVADTFTFGVNYYITNYIVARLDYSYTHLDQPYNLNFCNDKNLHAIQARIGFEF